MSEVILSDAFYFELSDKDQVWPSTVDGTFRISDGGEGHNVLGKGERNVSEKDMIDGVLNNGKVSRFRSKTNAARVKSPNHFFACSPSVVHVFVNVGGVYVRLR